MACSFRRAEVGCAALFAENGTNAMIVVSGWSRCSPTNPEKMQRPFRGETFDDWLEDFCFIECTYGRLAKYADPARSVSGLPLLHSVNFTVMFGRVSRLASLSEGISYLIKWTTVGKNQYSSSIPPLVLATIFHWRKRGFNSARARAALLRKLKNSKKISLEDQDEREWNQLAGPVSRCIPLLRH
jgi:hypothetical protein